LWHAGSIFGRETADFRHMHRAGINGLFALAA
jgi:hypothetical protein